jgi:hypothetical protein
MPRRAAEELENEVYSDAYETHQVLRCQQPGWLYRSRGWLGPASISSSNPYPEMELEVLRCQEYSTGLVQLFTN